MKFAAKPIRHFSRHRRHVATLPWEIKNSNFLQIFSRYERKCWKMLYWLPVQQRIDYKIALLTFKVRSTSTPLYLRRLIKDREHVHNLRSATTSLSQPSPRTTFVKRAFRCSVPAIWNSLPKTVTDSDSVAAFKSRLKTFLFSQAYSLSSSCSH